MSFVARIRRWLGRAADPADLHPGTEVPDGGAAQTGLDRPFPASGPVADPPVTDPPPAPPPERPMG